MSKIFNLALFVILFPIIMAEIGKIYSKSGPRGMPANKTTSCEEFGQYARFNPYSIVGFTWFVFFYWAPPTTTMIYKFRIPTPVDTSYLHFILDKHVKNFNWSDTMLLMQDQTDHTSLLVQRGDRGQFWLYMLTRDIPLGQLVKRYEVRLKQTGDNKYIAAMICKTRTAYVMSRINEIPPKAKLKDEAAKLGYIGRKGKSYLYQGHEWLPIPEADEDAFWELRSGREPEMEKLFQ